MDPIVTNYLFKLEFGELQIFNNMGVIPLFASVNDGLRYLTLKEALERGHLVITEISKSGSVPELRVVNKAEIPVLLLDGEELAGAKQNRVLNTTILLKEESETIIPVSCTEHGRWSYASAEFFDSGNIMNRNLRSRKASSVSRSLQASRSYRGNQGAIWEGIDRCAMMANVHSSTGAMSDIYESKERDLKGYLDAFKYNPHQRGIFVMVNGRVAGFDVLSFESAYEIIHPKLVKSYTMDALLERQRDHETPSMEKARAFLKEAESCNETRFGSLGYGWDHRFENNHMVGSALVYEEQVIHLAFFEAGESERIDRISSASSRRRFRI
jgi:hypothetical protein